jgi:hypothetical protein
VVAVVGVRNAGRGHEAKSRRGGGKTDTFHRLLLLEPQPWGGKVPGRTHGEAGSSVLSLLPEGEVWVQQNLMAARLPEGLGWSRALRVGSADGAKRHP